MFCQIQEYFHFKKKFTPSAINLKIPEFIKGFQIAFMYLRLKIDMAYV